MVSPLRLSRDAEHSSEWLVRRLAYQQLDELSQASQLLVNGFQPSMKLLLTRFSREETFLPERVNNTFINAQSNTRFPGRCTI
jgi:hypothetical protein